MIPERSPLAGLAVLVADDENLLRKRIAADLEKLGADVTPASSLENARNFLREMNFDFALLDVNFPDGSGLSLLREKAVSGATGVIVMTGNAEITGAVEAIKLGALDYLVKPFDSSQLVLAMSRARRSRQAARADEHRRESEASQNFIFGETLAGLAAQLEKVLAADRRVESYLPPILIQGETGTGKTTIARWIHEHGPRNGKPLIEVNCSSLPENLAESELFGHERGAFTDARAARMGLFEAAHEGTLFLDELPSLSLGLQAKVLKAVEDHRVRRLGGNKEIPIDVRLIAATHRNLKEAVAAGEFREDLYHRLDLYRISIPPLRTRAKDIVMLAEALLERLAQRHRVPAKKISAGGQTRLLNYSWPGNVRELANELERAVVFDDSAEFGFEHLSAAAGPVAPASGAMAGDDWFNQSFTFPAAGFSLEKAITRLLHHALNQTNQNVSAAARLLGVSRDYIRYRLSGQAQNSGSEPPPEA